MIGLNMLGGLDLTFLEQELSVGTTELDLNELSDKTGIPLQLLENIDFSQEPQKLFAEIFAISQSLEQEAPAVSAHLSLESEPAISGQKRQGAASYVLIPQEKSIQPPQQQAPTRPAESVQQEQAPTLQPVSTQQPLMSALQPLSTEQQAPLSEGVDDAVESLDRFTPLSQAPLQTQVSPKAKNTSFEVNTAVDLTESTDTELTDFLVREEAIFPKNAFNELQQTFGNETQPVKPQQMAAPVMLAQNNAQYFLQTPNNISMNVENVQHAGVTLTQVATPVTSPEWGQAFSQHIVSIATNEIKNASIRLDPPDLGPIEINIDLDNEKTTIHFNVQHAPVREAIENTIPRLRELFTHTGLELGDVNISSQTEEQGQQQAHDSEEAHSSLESESSEKAQAQSSQKQQTEPQGLVDYYV